MYTVYVPFVYLTSTSQYKILYTSIGFNWLKKSCDANLVILKHPVLHIVSSCFFTISYHQHFSHHLSPIREGFSMDFPKFCMADHGSMAYGLHHGLHLPSHGGEAGAESTLAADLPSLRRSMRLTGQRRQLRQTPRPGWPGNGNASWPSGNLVPCVRTCSRQLRQLNYTDLV